MVERNTKAVVLVVEDEALLRMAASFLVEDAGLEPLEAANGEAAISLLKSRADIRIVFTDVDMPGSIDGRKLASTVREQWPQIEIIVTSGQHCESLADLPGGSVFFRKPYDEGAVITQLCRMAA